MSALAYLPLAILFGLWARAGLRRWVRDRADV